jgi:hypothetical protein
LFNQNGSNYPNRSPNAIKEAAHNFPLQKISKRKFSGENFERENFGKKFRDRYAWSVVSSVYFHSSFTYSVGIDGIVEIKGSCKAVER